MAQIDGFPAGIGGHDDEIYLTEVEIYRNKNWEKFPSLNSKRRSCGAITCFSKVYVFGGTSPNRDDFYILNSIEKYKKGVWIDLPAKILSNGRGFGLFVSGTNIIIFGGEDKECNYYSNCSILNERTLNFWEIEFKLKKHLKFSSFIFIMYN